MANKADQLVKRDIHTAPPPAALRDKGLAARDDLEGQRRRVTVLFADVVGYTPLARKLGEEETFLFMQRLIRERSAAVDCLRQRGKA